MSVTLPFTSVVSYHTNPLTCGVAKFSAELAKRLGVPFTGLLSSDHDGGNLPLYSLKFSELGGFNVLAVNAERYGVFWHDAGEKFITDNAEFVFYADPSLGSPGLWCPSLITPRKHPVKLFSFGFAHKLQTEHYRKVRELLDAASIRYHLRVSVGIHEGTSLDGAEKHFDALREIMGPDNVTILGILSDDAVSEELSNCDYVLAFFENGVRHNNTTVHAALDADRKVITNGAPILDTLSLDYLDEWPTRYNPWSWDHLIEAMRKACEKSKSRIA